MARHASRFGRRRRRSRWRWPLWTGVLALAAFAAIGLLRPSWVLQAEFARQRLLAGAAQHSQHIDGETWHWLEAGEGPPLILLHGFTGSKENWLPVIAALARRHRVIAPDLPGHGFSGDVPRPPYGYVADAARLASFVDTVVARQPFDLVGHSMGGGIVTVYAAGAPQRVRRLALVSAAGVEFDNDFARAALAGEHPFAVHDRASLARFLALVFEHPPWVPWPADRALIGHRRANAPFERELLVTMTTGPDADAPARAAPAIAAPTLLLWCRGDRVVDVSAATVYAELLPASRTELLYGCNHMPMMERPQLVAEILAGFFGADPPPLPRAHVAPAPDLDVDGGGDAEADPLADDPAPAADRRAGADPALEPPVPPAR